MRTVPAVRLSRWQARAVIAALLLSACDVSPFVVDRSQTAGRADAPMETVTAVEVDADLVTGRLPLGPPDPTAPPTSEQPR